MKQLKRILRKFKKPDIRILEIYHCLRCPYYLITEKSGTYCSKEYPSRLVTKLDGFIPKWCSLPKKKGGNN